MKFLKNNKKRVILFLFILSTVLFGLKLLFFQLDGTSIIGKKIFITLIAIVNISIILMMILPKSKSLKTFINKYIDMILFGLFLYSLEYIFLIENHLDYKALTIFAIAFITSIFIILFLIIPKKIKLGFMIFITLFLTIYAIFQDIYFVIFSDFASVKESVSAKEGVEFSSGVINFEWIHLAYFLLGCLFVFLLIKYRRDNHVSIRKNKKMLFVPVMIFLISNYSAEYPVNTARLHLSDHYLYESVYSRKKFVSRFGTANFLMRDLIDGAVPNIPSKKDVKDVENYFKENEKIHTSNEYSGIFENKNVIFIMAESFDDIAINETLTPNIVKMKNEGIDFTNHYVPVYPRTTCDSEIIYNTSIIPSITDGPTCYTYNENSYSHSIANLFKNKGYEANGFHANYKEFYTRYKVYDGFGYDNFYGQDELGLNDKNKHMDTIFFEAAKDNIIKPGGKFFSYVTTLSGHSPYNMDNEVVEKHYKTVDDYYGDSVSEDIKAYIATGIELDLFVGMVFDDLTSKGLLEETVVILTSDHFPYTLPPSSYSEFTGISDLYMKSKSPLIIWSSDLNPTKVDKLTSSFDVLPTLANMFGLHANYTYYFGNDVFNDNYQPVVFYKDYSWYDGYNYVSDGKVKNDGIGEKDYINDLTDDINQFFEISKKILRTNYFE